jgi:hypothetical protein
LNFDIGHFFSIILLLRIAKSATSLFHRPSAVDIGHLIHVIPFGDLTHRADGFAQSRGHLAIMCSTSPKWRIL